MPKTKMSIGVVFGVITAVGISLFAYLMWFTAPTNTTENVKVIAVTESGCIAETSDGYSVNIGQCNANPGDSVIATYDTKVKQRIKAVVP